MKIIKSFVNAAQKKECKVAADLLSLAFTAPPESGEQIFVLAVLKDLVFQWSYGGPHAAFFATKMSLKEYAGQNNWNFKRC